MTIFKNKRDGKLYTVSIIYVTGARIAEPYNRFGESFEIKSEAAWRDFVPVAYRESRN